MRRWPTRPSSVARSRPTAIQLHWIAPTDTYLELGVEAGAGRGIPVPEQRAQPQRLGQRCSAHARRRHRRERELARRRLPRAEPSRRPRLRGHRQHRRPVTNAFTGDSDTWVAGRRLQVGAGRQPHRRTSFKLQGEYFRRRETGHAGPTTSTAASPDGERRATARASRGWYLQGIYQFARSGASACATTVSSSGTPDIGLVSAGTLSAADFPSLQSASARRARARWSTTRSSEFSRLRLQLGARPRSPGSHRPAAVPAIHHEPRRPCGATASEEAAP